jgi:hypothetical protein
MVLKDFFFSDFAKSSTAKFYRWTNNLFWLFFHSLSLYRFSTDSSRKQSPFYANRISTVCHVARIFSPSAPHAIATIDNSIFSTFE